MNLEFVGLAKMIRVLLNKVPAKIDPKAPNQLDPARG